MVMRSFLNVCFQKLGGVAGGGLLIFLQLENEWVSVGVTNTKILQLCWPQHGQTTFGPQTSSWLVSLVTDSNNQSYSATTVLFSLVHIQSEEADMLAAYDYCRHKHFLSAPLCPLTKRGNMQVIKVSGSAVTTQHSAVQSLIHIKTVNTMSTIALYGYETFEWNIKGVCFLHESF